MTSISFILLLKTNEYEFSSHKLNHSKASYNEESSSCDHKEFHKFYIYPQSTLFTPDILIINRNWPSVCVPFWKLGLSVQKPKKNHFNSDKSITTAFENSPEYLESRFQTAAQESVRFYGHHHMDTSHMLVWSLCLFFF